MALHVGSSKRRAACGNTVRSHQGCPGGLRRWDLLATPGKAPWPDSRSAAPIEIGQVVPNRPEAVRVLRTGPCLRATLPHADPDPCRDPEELAARAGAVHRSRAPRARGRVHMAG